MSTERLRQLALVLVCAVVLWGLASVLRGGNDERTSDGFALPEFVVAQLTGISLVGGADTIILNRRDDVWLVNGFNATPSLVDALIESLSDSDLTSELISIAATSHERLGVAGSNGKLLALTGASGEIGAFIVGNRGPGFGTIYARQPASDETYLLRTDLGNHVFRTQNDWREHQIIGLEPASIASMEVARRSGGYTLSRGDSGWTFAGGEEADSAAVSRLMGRFSSVRATGFAADSDNVDLNRPDMVIDLKDSTGSQLSKLEFDSTAAGFWVRAAHDSTVFKMANWAVLQLAPADSMLR